MTATRILPGTGAGPVLAMDQGLSFWGGVDPDSAFVIDEHHPAYRADLNGRVVLMPTTRGSCSGSGVMLELMLNGNAPAALIFSEAEDVATLGALIGAEMFGQTLPVLRVTRADLAALARAERLSITEGAIIGDGIALPIAEMPDSALTLSAEDEAILAGHDGEAAALAMRIICTMARLQGAAAMTDVTRGHIDGCILANQANLIFAEKMQALGAKVRVPTTINAISVDRRNWQAQGVPLLFGNQASRLADAYTRMGCRPSFTCAPYLLKDRPARSEDIAWAESNAVIYANTVLGARTPKHPDYLDLCIAMTGRAPLAGVYLEPERRPARVLEIDPPMGADDSFWPLVGYVAGLKSPDRIPLLRGIAVLSPTKDDLKALCAAFGTTSAAPMLHVKGATPECRLPLREGADTLRIARADLEAAWHRLNQGPEQVDLVAIGSPHASADECRYFAHLLNGWPVKIPTILTAGREIIAAIETDGTLATLTELGVQVIPDLCWCSITEPVFPSKTKTVMTNSGKYAHYGPGLSGRALRFGSMAACAEASVTGFAPNTLPDWLQPKEGPAHA
ncbi:MAG TPA: aconitase X [Paracoccus sp. (in: a-proteobacteria)]|uniref:cis-3-hydroxy-L-proline dehydratase n=1 Tax=uncultured Paracoccus sp. TaxID=189685 RepID=UPI002617F15B|nr:aconitase X [uncultured Paracoccus sp.]HMQ40954.1 aconitase X [Paracoccus sp. (in: a-proteobacteria)]HMR36284.1 aconitase X [Paracoccus sp. (in: a-proteobacteria)]